MKNTFHQKCKCSASFHCQKTKGISTRRVFMSAVEFPRYKIYKSTDYKNFYYIYDREMYLPSSTMNSEDDIHHVCEVI